MACLLRVEYSGTLSHLTARSNDQPTIVHDATDRTDFLTRLGQEILPQRWRSAKSSNDPTRHRSHLDFHLWVRVLDRRSGCRQAAHRETPDIRPCGFRRRDEREWASASAEDLESEIGRDKLHVLRWENLPVTSSEEKSI